MTNEDNSEIQVILKDWYGDSTLVATDCGDKVVFNTRYQTEWKSEIIISRSQLKPLLWFLVKHFLRSLLPCRA